MPVFLSVIFVISYVFNHGILFTWMHEMINLSYRCKALLWILALMLQWFLKKKLFSKLTPYLHCFVISSLWNMFRSLFWIKSPLPIRKLCVKFSWICLSGSRKELKNVKCLLTDGRTTGNGLIELFWSSISKSS